MASRNPLTAFAKHLVKVPLTAAPQAIEIAADSAALRAMVTKTAAAWETVGETAPYHSILTSDEYRPERFAENGISFFETGNHDLALILALLHCIGRPAEGFRRCLEFGCGVVGSLPPENMHMHVTPQRQYWSSRGTLAAPFLTFVRKHRPIG